MPPFPHTRDQVARKPGTAARHRPGPATQAGPQVHPSGRLAAARGTSRLITLRQVADPGLKFMAETILCGSTCVAAQRAGAGIRRWEGGGGRVWRGNPSAQPPTTVLQAALLQAAAAPQPSQSATSQAGKASPRGPRGPGDDRQACWLEGSDALRPSGPQAPEPSQRKVRDEG